MSPVSLIAKKTDCSQCLSIPNAFCLANQEAPMLGRMDFNLMVEKVSKIAEQVCTCSDGYLPIYNPASRKEVLMRCHDPIIATATIGGRCLGQKHCNSLGNSVCQDDDNVKLPNGTPIMTCQCMPGYLDNRYSCELDVTPTANSGQMDIFFKNLEKILEKNI